MSVTVAVPTETRMQRLRFFLIIGSLTAFATLSIDMYLPALPAIWTEFHTGASDVQLTLTTFLIGLALGQLLVGPISDKVGRRRPVYTGLAIYAAASIGCAVAPSVYALAGLRLLQGMAGASGVVIARAIVRDLHSGIAAVRYFSLLMLITGLGPILAPSIGAQILRFTSWRGMFLVLAAVGLLVPLAVAAGLGETLPVEQRRTGGLRDSVAAFRELFGDRTFLGYALTLALSFATIFAYIGGSSFVLQGLYGISPQQYAVVFGVNGVGLVAANQLNRHFVGRISPMRLLTGGSLALAGASLMILAVVVAGERGLAWILVPLFVVMFSLGFVMPNATGLALTRHPRAAGTASALLGALQMASGAVAAPLAGIAGPRSALPMALVMALFGVGASASLLLRGGATRVAAAQPVNELVDGSPVL
jgi:DHA1 family bicyclomycin/chloramphenicol resistance-like MFS transporter